MKPWRCPRKSPRCLALRTQQILAHETGVANTVDPVGGSYAIEALTNEIEAPRARASNESTPWAACCARSKRATCSARSKRRLTNTSKASEQSERIIVGVNRYRAERDEPIPMMRIDPAHRAGADRATAGAARRRDSARANAAIAEVESRARTGENLMPAILAAVEAYATVGEISDALRRVFGEHRETLAL